MSQMQLFPMMAIKQRCLYSALEYSADIEKLLNVVFVLQVTSLK